MKGRIKYDINNKQILIQIFMCLHAFVILTLRKAMNEPTLVIEKL